MKFKDFYEYHYFNLIVCFQFCILVFAFKQKFWKNCLRDETYFIRAPEIIITHINRTHRIKKFPQYPEENTLNVFKAFKKFLLNHLIFPYYFLLHFMVFWDFRDLQELLLCSARKKKLLSSYIFATCFFYCSWEI